MHGLNETFKNKKIIDFILLILFIFSFGGVVNIISVKLDFKILRVWKELLVLIIFFLAILNLIKYKEKARKKYIFLIFVVIPCVIAYFLLPIGQDLVLILYQFKGDFIPILIPVSLYLVIRNKMQWDYFLEKLTKYIIFSALINSVFVYFESIFTNLFITILGVSEYYNNRGGASGIRLDSTMGGLRAMGLTTSFGIAASLLFIAIILLIEIKPFKRFTTWLMILFFLGAMIATTYKTTLIALIFYFLFKIISLVVKKIKIKKFIIGIITLILFSWMAFAFNNMELYNSIAVTKYKDLAWGSIYLRVIQHEDIENDIAKNNDEVFGLGLGVNGTSGPDESKKINSKALDSLYINILSNYGYAGLFIFLTMLLFMYTYILFVENKYTIISSLCIFYIVGAEFFTNNTFGAFPTNIYLYTLILIPIMFKEEKENGKKI